jgi:hypothetical protein
MSHRRALAPDTRLLQLNLSERVPVGDRAGPEVVDEYVGHLVRGQDLVRRDGSDVTSSKSLPSGMTQRLSEYRLTPSRTCTNRRNSAYCFSAEPFNCKLVRPLIVYAWVAFTRLEPSLSPILG